MLDAKLVDKLNDQINLEFFSSNLYLQMAAWCDWKGLPGAAKFLHGHAAEEMEHMQRLFSYVSETGALPILGAIEAPQAEFEGLEQIFEMTFEHEKKVTASINDLVDTAFSIKDYSTFNFLQWYVAEQHEEESLFSGILDRIRLIGADGRGLFHIDSELQKMAAAEAAPTAGE